jgi:hypothetical protein
LTGEACLLPQKQSVSPLPVRDICSQFPSSDISVDKTSSSKQYSIEEFWYCIQKQEMKIPILSVVYDS